MKERINTVLASFSFETAQSVVSKDVEKLAVPKHVKHSFDICTGIFKGRPKRSKSIGIASNVWHYDSPPRRDDPLRLVDMAFSRYDADAVED